MREVIFNRVVNNSMSEQVPEDVRYAYCEE